MAFVPTGSTPGTVSFGRHTYTAFDDDGRRLDGNARLNRHYLEGGPVQYELVKYNRTPSDISEVFGRILTLRNRDTRNPRTDPFSESILLHQANLHDTYAVGHLYHGGGRTGKDGPHGD